MGIRAVGIFAIVSLTERHPIVFIKLRVLRLCGANANLQYRDPIVIGRPPPVRGKHITHSNSHIPSR